MRDPVYLVLREIDFGSSYGSEDAFPSLAEARKAADLWARDNPGTTYVIAAVGQSVTAEISTRWDE